MSDDLPRLAGQPLFAVDSSPLAGSRSQMVIAMLRLFGEVRSLFAQTPEAKTRQINARFFSLHVAGSGRCASCKGTGRLVTDLTYFEEAEIPCPNCLGRRYRRDALEIRFRGLNMAEVLDLTIADALGHFKGHGKLLQALTMLSRTGLAYLRLGQSLATLSGGERQRVKLSIALGKPSEKSIFVCDEPSLGLHPQDVTRLIDCFQQLVDVGHTVWIADSHPQLVEAADWLITLQKSPQPLGTRITFEGRQDMIK
jgi:excinuclease ABC subunit A